MIDKLLDPLLCTYLVSVCLMLFGSIILILKNKSISSAMIFIGFLLVLVGTGLINFVPPEWINYQYDDDDVVAAHFKLSNWADIGFKLGPVGSLLAAIGFIIHVKQYDSKNS